MYLHSRTVQSIFNNVTADDVPLLGGGRAGDTIIDVSVQGRKRHSHLKGIAEGQLSATSLFIPPQPLDIWYMWCRSKDTTVSMHAGRFPFKGAICKFSVKAYQQNVTGSQSIFFCIQQQLC